MADLCGRARRSSLRLNSIPNFHPPQDHPPTPISEHQRKQEARRLVYHRHVRVMKVDFVTFLNNARPRKTALSETQETLNPRSETPMSQFTTTSNDHDKQTGIDFALPLRSREGVQISPMSCPKTVNYAGRIIRMQNPTWIEPFNVGIISQL
jgi:hypothetical protein